MPTPPSRLPSLLPIPAVAEKLGVCPRTVRRWIAHGDLHVHRLGRQLRVSGEDLQMFLGMRRK